MIIDAHHHLWRYNPEEYGWIDPSMGVIARDFAIEDLARVAAPLGVEGSVVVQARQSLEETYSLLEIASHDPFVLGVVGWAPLAADDAALTLDRLLPHPKLKGLRHVVQDEPDDDFILGKAFGRGVRAALDRGLAYDLLVFARQLPQTIEFVDRHPDGRFVLDHIAKPEIAADNREPWAADIRRLAERPNVACKLSGVATEADWRAWTLDSIRYYLDTALDTFGAERLMFGSDWPVCLLATDYPRWLRTVEQWSAALSTAERDSLFHGAATRAYNLQPQ